jgi:hypothetical protein
MLTTGLLPTYIDLYLYRTLFVEREFEEGWMEEMQDLLANRPTNEANHCSTFDRWLPRVLKPRSSKNKN